MEALRDILVGIISSFANTHMKKNSAGFIPAELFARTNRRGFYTRKKTVKSTPIYIVKSLFFLYAKLEKCGKIYALLCINQYGGIV